ncbi:unnamed protein product [Citrullus colocynthis]|uniref:Uncharacterized protein n=1 Tax=Citrullus colocynthis TaxID=252529 RepID=A0ABP0YSA4_9ROSI
MGLGKNLSKSLAITDIVLLELGGFSLVYQAFGVYWSLTHMPKGLGELTNLETMNMFVFGGHNSGELNELNGLNKLKGRLSIKNLKFCSPADLQMKAKFLQLKSGLQILDLQWHNPFNHEPTIDISDDD